MIATAHDSVQLAKALQCRRAGRFLARSSWRLGNGCPRELRTLLAVMTIFMATAFARSVHAASITVFSEPADYEVEINTATGADRVSNGVGNDLRVGYSSGATPLNSSAIFLFALPAIPVGEMVTGATFSVELNAAVAQTPFANADLYGLPYDPAPVDATVGTVPARFYTGPNDTTDATKLQDNLFTPTDAGAVEPDNRKTVDITSYIQGLYVAGAIAGDYAVLRLSYDVETLDETVTNRYRFRSGDAAVPEVDRPTLTLEIIPEPGTTSILGLTTFVLLARRRRSNSALVFGAGGQLVEVDRA